MFNRLNHIYYKLNKILYYFVMINYYVEYSIIVSKFHFMKLEINKKIL